MKLCIAEKPSVAKEIAHVIGATQRRDGYFEGAGYYVTWSFGHLCQLKEPQDYDPKLKKWSIPSLPIIPEKFGIKLIAKKGIKKQFNTIKALVGKSEYVINCGDAGQEGELIQRWVLSFAGYKKDMKRLWISSLTEEAIRDGFNHLKEGKDFDNLYYAGASRAISDWILGMNATRLFTMKYATGKGVLSVGRVQTPTLALIVKRYHEILNFKPSPYWEVMALYRDVEFSYIKGKFTDKEAASSFVEAITGHDLHIHTVETKNGKEHAQKLFDLTSLQIECNRKFGMSADQTLKTVQSLYEKKVVSYPRVDTTFLPNDVYPKITGILSSLQDYTELTQPLLKDEIRKSTKVFNDNKVTDHHAIIPTNKTASNLMGVELKVYDLIAKRFIAAFYPDCLFAKTLVKAKINEHDFKTSGKQILDPGWRVVFSKDKKNDKEEECLLPDFIKGESGPHKPKLTEKMTKPPKEYTEATLLRAMETAGKLTEDEELAETLKQNGIGRPSTRAAIIETLFRRKYIKKDKRKLNPTEIGIQLIAAIKDDTLKSVELTGLWEKKLKQIASGDYSKHDFLQEMRVFVSGIIQSVNSDESALKIQLANYPKSYSKSFKKKYPTKSKSKSKIQRKSTSVANTKCPKCKIGTIITGRQAFGCNRYKEGCHYVLPFTSPAKPTSTKVKTF